MKSIVRIVLITGLAPGLMSLSWVHRDWSLCHGATRLVGLLAWWFTPYVTYWRVWRYLKPLPCILAGVLGVGYDIALRIGTFHHQDSPEAVLRTALLAPPMVLLVVMPSGAFLGWVTDRIVRRMH